MKKLIDANKVERITWEEPYYSDPLNVLTEVREKVRALPEVEAIITDDNFGFAAYIIENDKYGIRVEETWNKDLDDEEMMAVMTGLIQDILADERLTRLWNDATDLAKFMMGVGDNIARVS